jgi:hypothetical protein
MRPLEKGDEHAWRAPHPRAVPSGRITWLGIAPLAAVQAGAPQPDGSVWMQTTAIAPGQGITGANGQLRFQHHDFTCVLSTKTRADPTVLRHPSLRNR